MLEYLVPRYFIDVPAFYVRLVLPGMNTTLNYRIRYDHYYYNITPTYNMYLPGIPLLLLYVPVNASYATERYGCVLGCARKFGE